MKVLKSLLRIAAVLLLLMILALLLLTRWPTDPPASPPSVFGPRPKLQSPLPTLSMEVLETAYTEAPEALVVQGGSWFKKKRYSHAAILIRHPKGKVLFDGGVGTKILEEIQRVPGFRGWMLQNLAKNVLIKPLGEHLALRGLDPARDFFILSHGHWDHLSGFLDFPSIPIRILPEEAEFSSSRDPYSHGVFPEQWSAARDRIQYLFLQERRYENFSQSLDLFGDGSLIVVSLAGHTPGSVGLFVNLPSGDRFFLVGDAIHGILPDGSPEVRTLLMELMSDHDRMRARRIRQKLSDLIAHSNEVKLVPTHEPDPLLKHRP